MGSDDDREVSRARRPIEVRIGAAKQQPRWRLGGWMLAFAAMLLGAWVPWLGLSIVAPTLVLLGVAMLTRTEATPRTVRVLENGVEVERSGINELWRWSEIECVGRHFGLLVISTRRGEIRVPVSAITDLDAFRAALPPEIPRRLPAPTAGTPGGRAVTHYVAGLFVVMTLVYLVTRPGMREAICP